jgi:hypothetical protein
MKKLILSVIFGVLSVSSTGYSQAVVWTTANQITKTWDAVTALETGAPIPAGDIVTYQVYIKNEDGSNIVKAGIPVSVLTATIVFTAEGRYFYGVSAIRKTVSGIISESPVSWSDNPAVMKTGIPQGIQYFLVLKQPILN